MAASQKLIVLLALVLIVVSAFFAPFAYSIPSDIVGEGPYLNVVYAPLWAAPDAQTFSSGPVQETFPAQLLVVRWLRSCRLRGA